MKLYQTAPLSRARPSLRGRGKWKRPCPPPHRGGNGFQMFSIQLDSFCLLKRIRYVTGCLGMPWTCRQMSTGNLIALWIQCVDMSTNVASVPIAVFFPDVVFSSCCQNNLAKMVHSKIQQVSQRVHNLSDPLKIISSDHIRPLYRQLKFNHIVQTFWNSFSMSPWFWNSFFHGKFSVGKPWLSDGVKGHGMTWDDPWWPQGMTSLARRLPWSARWRTPAAHGCAGTWRSLHKKKGSIWKHQNGYHVDMKINMKMNCEINMKWIWNESWTFIDFVSAHNARSSNIVGDPCIWKASVMPAMPNSDQGTFPLMCYSSGWTPPVPVIPRLAGCVLIFGLEKNILPQFGHSCAEKMWRNVENVER